jgi:hypothetical protein
LQSQNRPAHRLGTVGGDALAVSVAGETLRWSLAEIHDDWFNAIAKALHQELTPA